MLPLDSIERVWPFRLSPLPLLRALLAGDTEGAELLGCLGLAEEDLALCSHACSGRNDYGSALRRTLDAIERDA
jgi:Na+-transporting NADH:ubiquinone oxidoreductase subunit A